MAPVKLSKKKAHQVYRLKDGTIVPGGSTISKIGEDQGFLIRWAWKQGIQGIDYTKVTDEAGEIGTVAHFMISAHFRGFTPDFSEFSPNVVAKAQMVFNKFLQTWKEEELTYVANEVELVSETLRYGGTLDLIARDKHNRLLLIDEKSSPRIYGHFYRQVAGYEALWNENNLEKIYRCKIFRHGKVDPEDTEIKNLPPDMSKHFNVFKKQLALYYAFDELS
jgi:hypothetical protein